MGRALRIDKENEIYHVLNRSNARLPIFEKEDDFILFEKILTEAKERYSVNIFSYQIMPNHWHFCLSPTNDGDMTRFIRWITLTHTQRWHANRRSIGFGHLYQGRYKSFLVQKDNYFLQLCLYIESNALRAKIVKRAEDWRWSSLWRRCYGNDKERNLLSPWPIEAPRDYIEEVNTNFNDKDLESIRMSVLKNRPFGDNDWVGDVVKRFNLGITLREPGRPKNGS